MVAKPLINLHVTPNGCGIFGCENDKDNYYPDDYYQYNEYPNNFNTRRHQPSSQKNNFFPSSNKPKRHYQADDFFKPSNAYPSYSQQNPTFQQYGGNRQTHQNTPYHNKNLHYPNRQNPSSIYDNLQGSQQSVFDALRLSQNGNNGYTGTNTKVKFGGSNQNRQPAQVIRHEHYHFHESENKNQHNSNYQNRATVAQLTPTHEGISFGQNNYQGYLNEVPRFRSSLDADENNGDIVAELDKTNSESENVKRKTPLGPKNNAKNTFSFPKGETNQKILNRSKRDDQPPYSLAPEPAKTIQAVRDSLEN